MVARVLGVRLLKLDATVVLAPADVAVPAPGVHRPTALAPARSTAATRTLPAPVGRGLAQAVRTLDEGAKLLAEAQRDSAQYGG